MNWSQWRWTLWPLGAALLAWALVAVSALPPLAVEAAWLRNWHRTEEGRVSARLFALRDSANVYRAAWEIADTRERVAREPAAAPGLSIRIDPTVPRALERELVPRIEREYATLTDVARARVIVRLLVDSIAIGYRRAVVLPVDSAGACVVVLRFSPPAARALRVDADDPLLSTCGFFARFGAPGRGMRDWLTRTQLRTADAHTAPALAPPFRARALENAVALQTDPVGLSCGMGNRRACTMFLEDENLFSGFSRPYDDSRLPTARQLTASQRITVFRGDIPYDAPGRRLAALRATIGDARFALLWASDVGPSETFARHEGAPVEALISESLRVPEGRYVPGSRVRGWAMVVMLVSIAGFTVLGIGGSRRLYRA